MSVELRSLRPGKKKAKHKRKKLPESVRWMILERAQGKCELCGASLEYEGVLLTVDHIVPIAMGGTDSPENLRALCSRCNTGKGSKIYTESRWQGRKTGWVGQPKVKRRKK